ncbi:hypothetical protein [endosymbiont GvMRE of Glomus versiforme]|jgi:hypothetical protein|uniref:hypothetical protein n=1 Tax=endosymbiont GvMRE of Glomus versiforme TaxID=2039283 RepID=UPI000ED7E48F|nr:hypothetical protein [endosymbiont GvMRE of Glomus versiforme]RHZ36558.1 hypothetical protein GvMRE_I2g182 [endosymbiont GvMRE of Glomus versiforme]
MKFKTWEWIYWGIVLFFLILIMVAIIKSGKEGFKVTIKKHNQTTITYWSKPKAFGYLVGIPFGIMFTLWLIIKAATGGFKE